MIPRKLFFFCFTKIKKKAITLTILFDFSLFVLHLFVLSFSFYQVCHEISLLEHFHYYLANGQAFQ